jgi:hypothetical protein
MRVLPAIEAIPASNHAAEVKRSQVARALDDNEGSASKRSRDVERYTP